MKPELVLIAACAENRVIGRDGRLPWKIPGDLQRFKRLTMGHPMILGRKTWDSFGGRALPGRPHIILSRRGATDRVPGAAAPEGVFWVESLEQALAIARGLPGSDRIFVIGGGEIYGLALPLADTLELTEVQGAPPGDAYFPAFDRSLYTETARDFHPEPFPHSFVTLRRR